MVTEHELYKFEGELVYVSAIGLSKKGNSIVFYRNVLNPALKGKIAMEDEFLKTAKVIGIKEVKKILEII